MTDQYLPTNINGPRIVRIVDDENFQITYDDSIIAASTSTGPITLTLPDARTIPGWIVSVKAIDVSGGDITVIGSLGQAIDGNVAGVVLSNENESVILQSVGALWVILGGAGSIVSETCLTAFLVAPVASMANFTSIQDAYDAAVAAGAGASNPAKVLVCPGTYTEDIVMDTPGVDIIAVDVDRATTRSSAFGPTILQGQVTINLDNNPGGPGFNRCQWIGIDIVPNPAAPTLPLLSLEGAEDQAANISDCQMVSSVDPATGAIIEASNSGVSSASFVRTNVLWSSPTPGACECLSISSSMRISIDSSRLAAQPFGADDFGSAIELTAAATAAQINVSNSRLAGRVAAGAGTSSIEIVNSEVSETLIGVGGADNSVRLFGCSVSRIQPGLNWVDGGGTFVFDSIEWIETAEQDSTVGSSVVIEQRPTTPPGQFIYEVPFALAFTITTQTNIIGDVSGGPKAINLPLTAARTGPLRVKPNGTGNPLTLVPAGVETVNGVAGPFIVPSAGATLVADPASGDWQTFG